MRFFGFLTIWTFEDEFILFHHIWLMSARISAGRCSCSRRKNRLDRMASIGSKFIRLIWQGLKKENLFKRNLIMPMKFWTKLLIVLRNHLRYEIFYDLRRFNLRLKVILNWDSIFWGFNCIFVERRTRPLIWVPTRRGFEIQKNHYLTSKKLKILFLKFYFVEKTKCRDTFLCKILRSFHFWY